MFRNWLSWATFCLLFASSYKYDVDIFAASEFMKGFQQPEYILIIKKFAPYALIVLPFFLIAMVAKNGRLSYPFRRGSLILGLLLIFECLRLIPSDLQYAVQLASAGVVVTVFILIGSYVSGSRNPADIPSEICRGVGAFGILHVALNLSIIATGMGFHHGRFLGTTIQPNFIGVQMGLLALFLMGTQYRRWYFNGLRLAALLGALAMLLMSGSRTGLIVFVVSSAGTLFLRGIKPIYVLAATIVFAIAINSYFAFSLDAEGFNQYDRNNVNTRAESWSYLFSLIDTNVFLGTGRLPNFSENSYLRGWSAVGIIYPLLLGVFIVYTIYNFIRIKLQGSPVPEHAVLCGALIGMLFGAIFEGFLFDSFTFSLYAFVLCALGTEAGISGMWKSRAIAGMGVRSTGEVVRF